MASERQCRRLEPWQGRAEATPPTGLVRAGLSIKRKDLIVGLMIATAAGGVCAWAPVVVDRGAAGTPVARDAARLAEVVGGICPVVYPVDETPGPKGYQFIFYGNAFFVDKDGYLLTAAHVLHSFGFGSGGQPYLLVARAEAPPRMVKTEVVVVDREHDVAVLRATPNPFLGGYRVRVLQLNGEGPARGQDILVAALRPSRRKPHTYETELQDESEAQVLEYVSSALEKGMGDTELFLFNHEVILGQSGAPILSGDGSGVVGFVEGQWLHPVAGGLQQGVASVGAGVPIRYAIAVLKGNGIAWAEAGGKGSEGTRQ